jgi:hypothetical protein
LRASAQCSGVSRCGWTLHSGSRESQSGATNRLSADFADYAECREDQPANDCLAPHTSGWLRATRSLLRRCENSGSQRRRREIPTFRSKIVVTMKGPAAFRAFSAKRVFNSSHLGRWPRLSHFAPLALRPRVFIQSLPLPVLYSSTHDGRLMLSSFGWKCQHGQTNTEATGSDLRLHARMWQLLSSRYCSRFCIRRPTLQAEITPPFLRQCR